MRIFLTQKSITLLSLSILFSVTSLTACNEQDSEKNQSTAETLTESKSNAINTDNQNELSISENQEPQSLDSDIENKTNSGNSTGDDLASELEREAMESADSVENGE